MIQIVRKLGPNTVDILMEGQVNNIPNVNPNIGEKLWIGQRPFEVVSREFFYEQVDGETSLVRLTLEVKEA